MSGQCYTVLSSVTQPILSAPITGPPKSIPFAQPTVLIEGSSNQLPESLHPNHPPLNQQRAVEDNLSQCSDAASRRSTKQRQLELQLQLLHEERKIQEAEESIRREYLRKRHELLKEMANENASLSDVEKERSSSDPRAARGKKETAYLNAHAGQASDGQQNRTIRTNKLAPPTPTEKLCPVCKASCPSVEKCARFVELGYNSRWATVKEFGGKEGKLNQPIATKTRLGWIIHGGSKLSGEFVGYHKTQRCSCDELNEAAVREYFAVENVGIYQPKYSLISTEDQRAIDILKSFKQTESGHYVSRLLWKYDNFRLPNSRSMALQRWRCLESRLKRDPELESILRMKLIEYCKKGYIRKLTEEELSQPRPQIWYLPIFPVFNPKKPGKVRIVWDAAAKTNGISLNSMLLTGPDLLTSLVYVLIKFRTNKVAICADVRELFHLVWISKEDQDCQRFLWKENPTDVAPSTFVMQVMTFGACCSPSWAQYVKNLNAEKHAGEYPAAATAIVQNHYVDDMLVSAETENEAIRLAQEVRHVQAKGGFQMGSWVSNSSAVLAALQKERIDEKSPNLGSELATEKVSGMWWQTATDERTFKLSPMHDIGLLSGDRRSTKREVLRTLMAIYDPLGLLSNLLIFLKVLLQKIWRAGVGWDDEIPENLHEQWGKWIGVLPLVQDVRIQRCYRSRTQIAPETRTQLHTFVDASEDGYAAVVYLLFQQKGVIECAIVAAKARVVPLKFVSIPRLELQAAVVDHRRYSQYVAFRVSTILETSDIANWRCASSKDNVADEATKWQRLSDLSRESRWLKGPKFLQQNSDDWPFEPFTTGSTTEEIRPSLLHHRITLKPRLPVEDFKLQQASHRVIRQAQYDSFPEEIEILLSSNATAETLPKQSTIYTMSPFLDEQRVMRMRGRISQCEYATMDARNPIILPRIHHITMLVVRDYHMRYHHRNHETVINELRQVYRIPKLRVVYRSMRASCQRCKNEKAHPQAPMMGELPEARLAAFSRPFTFVGVDYFGPFAVSVGRRSEKRWGVLVTCLTTRAIHIEIAHTLNADSCMMALRNFMARRGVPRKIFSDRGTNFVATNKELELTLQELDHIKIVQEIVSPHTEWCFLPPASPHMGGAWERLIQIVKRNLQDMQPRRQLSDETFRNLLIEIESIYNSRPLTHVPAEDPEAPVLTPNHLILGSSSGLKPVTSFDDSTEALKRSWRASQAEANIFWRRWVRDYLPDLTRRTKWYGDVKPVEVGDIVVIVDPGNPRNCWPKGSVISVNTDEDGRVRSAAVQTASGGVYERPMVKLAVLDVRRDA
ncbi:uncharacterized protein LOC129716699 [Wyeomyia smithii]|uniref:uncharacterized protein LOC129716699 n=1 Tax=Wyeomyia smithii TaxID=174621 RepID=UPI002467EDF1|nr:uncharacterized protein LOC129716699 [Wyeomyia smithii]